MVATGTARAAGQRLTWVAAGTAGMFGAVALLGFLPYVWTFHMVPIPSYYNEVIAALCLALALLCSGALEGATASVAWPLPALLVTLTALGFVQQGLGMLVYAQQAVRFGLYAACMLAAYVFGRRLVSAGRAEEAMKLFSAAVLAGGLYTVLVQWLQLFDLEVLPAAIAVVYKDSVMQARPFGNVAQANHAGTYIAMAAISAVYWLRRGGSSFAVPALLVTGSGLALAGSRMSVLFLGIIVAAMFTPTALRPATARLSRIGSVSLLAGYAVGLVAVRLMANGLDVLKRFFEHSWPIREELLWQAWHIALQHPWLGMGVGQFAAGSYWVARESPFTLPASTCHNLVMEMAVEFGWPAATAVCAFAISWFLRGLSARLARAETALAIAMLLLIGVHSMLEFPLWYLFFTIPTGLLLGLGESERGPHVAAKVNRILPVTGLIMIGVTVTYTLEYFWIEQAAIPTWLELGHARKRQPEDALVVLAVSNSRLFAPEADRMMCDLNHPPGQSAEAQLGRAARSVLMLPAPELIVQYITLLVEAGRIDEALTTARRLHTFAGQAYPAWRDELLVRTRDMGPQTAPLRHLLRELN
jgi:O-antigen ligase